MSNMYSDNLINAIGIISKNETKKVKFDKTIRGTIVECVDPSLGKYRVNYQNSVIEAFATSPDVTYTKKENVYVQVPVDDFNKTKTILGSVTKLGSNFINVISEEEKLRPLGSTLIDGGSKYSGGVCSHRYNATLAGQADYHTFNVTKLVDTRALEISKENATCLVLAAKFKTALEPNQQSIGEYGLRLTYKMFNRVIDKDKIIANDFEGDIKQYLDENEYVIELNTKDMIGQPYKYATGSRQYIIVPLAGVYLYQITKLELFCEGFPNYDTNNTNLVDDIFVSNIECYLAEKLTDEELASTSLTFAPGRHYLTGKDDKITMQAIVRIKGKKVNTKEQSVQFYWFKKNGRVNSTTNQKYHRSGGPGWECLNKTSKTTEKTSSYFLPETSYFNISGELANNQTNYFKCAAEITQGSETFVFSQEFEITNSNSLYKIVIASSLPSNSFNFGLGEPILTAKVWKNNSEIVINKDNTIEEENTAKKEIYKFKWAYSIDGGTVSVASDNYTQEKGYFPNTHFVTLANVYSTVAYSCTVTKIKTTTTGKKVEEEIGVGQITLLNDKNQARYLLIINNGEQIFKYDEDGLAPTNEAYHGEQIELAALTFDIFDVKNGVSIFSQKTLKNKAKICSGIKWIWPGDPPDANGSIAKDTLSMLIYKGEKPLVRETIPGLTDSASNIHYQYICRDETFNYDIQPVFDARRNANNVTLQVVYRGEVLTASTNFSFVKDGDSGTNGTNFVIKLKPRNCEVITYDATKGFIEWEKSKSTFSFSFLGKKLNFASDNENDPLLYKIYNTANAGSDETATEISSGAKIEWGFAEKKKGKEDHSLKVSKNEKIFTFEGNSIKNKDEEDITGTKPSVLKLSILNTYPKHDSDKNDYFAYYPIQYKVNRKNGNGDNYYAIIEDGYKEVTYETDGSLGRYGQKPFYLRVFNKNGIELIDGFTVTWTCSWKGRIQTGAFGYKTNAKAKIDPQKPFDGEQDKYIHAKVTIENTESFDVYFYPFFHYNQYGLPSLNSWDGVSLGINENDSYVLATQVAAGKKNTDNTFTGITIGQTMYQGKAGDKIVEQTGLFGYAHGIQSIFLDANSGKAEFGTSDEGQIILDPGGTSTIAGWEINKNSLTSPNDDYKIHLISHSVKDKSGKLITRAGSIYSGEHNSVDANKEGYYIGYDGISLGKSSPNILFRVTKDGELTSKSGTIGGWKINSNSLISPGDKIHLIAHSILDKNGNTITKAGSIYSEEHDNFESTKAGYYIGVDGISLGSTFSVDDKGVLKSTSGTIGGWHIEKDKLWAVGKKGAGIRLNSDGSMNGGSGYDSSTKTGGSWFINADGSSEFNYITTNNIKANSGGEIGGWTIGSSTLTGGSLTLNSSGTITGDGWTLNSTTLNLNKGNSGGTVSGSGCSLGNSSGWLGGGGAKSAALSYDSTGVKLGGWKATSDSFYCDKASKSAYFTDTGHLYGTRIEVTNNGTFFGNGHEGMTADIDINGLTLQFQNGLYIGKSGSFKTNNKKQK